MSPRRRIFIRRSAKRLRVSLIAAAATLATIAACAPESAHWSPAQSPKRNDVRWIAFEHTARFADGADALSADERRRLATFLARHDARRDDRVMIGTPGTASRPGTVRAQGRREAAVSAALRHRDLQPQLLPKVPSAEPWDGTVRVVLGRFVVVPPDCPDWSKRANGDPANRRSSNFGCATATNLGLMVANPEDLVRGRTPGPADGATGARRYRDYREGEQQPAPAITPLILQSGVESEGGQ